MPIAATTRVWSTKQVQGLLWGVVKANEAQIEEGIVRVPLYQSGVRYAMEPIGSEVWQTAHETLILGTGDCEDLVAWLVAEYRQKGIMAEPYIKDVRPGLRHCLCLLPDGTLEDPSRKLGMGKV